MVVLVFFLNYGYYYLVFIWRFIRTERDDDVRTNTDCIFPPYRSCYNHRIVYVKGILFDRAIYVNVFFSYVAIRIQGDIPKNGHRIIR